MRKIVGMGLVGLALIASPASAATVKVSHQAPLSCTAVCAGWDVPSALSFEECNNPFPEGSYDQSVFAFTSTETGAAIDIVASSKYDYDTFVCTNTWPSLMVVSITNYIGGNCESRHFPGAPVALLGCIERGTVTWSGLRATLGFEPAAKDFIVRSFNWFDRGRNAVTLTGPVRLVSDSYVALCPLLPPC